MLSNFRRNSLTLQKQSCMITFGNQGFYIQKMILKCFIYLQFVVSSPFLYAQFGLQQVISIEGDGPQSVYAADLDGDTYKDVLSANKFGSDLTWYKNIGDGTFGPQQIIASLNQPKIIYSADLDGDNDLDVLATALFIDELVWYKNLDGLGNFSSQIIIANDLDGPYDVKAVDIDGDNDLDVICGSESSGLVWYENQDGLGNFSTKNIINASAPNSRSVVAIDLDGDNDLDIVGSSSGAVTVSWYENLNGLGAFGSQQIIAGSASTVTSVFAADLDGDLDNDVLSATAGTDKIAWFENTDGNGSFGSEQVITPQADFALSVFAADLDNDNDIDVLSASALDNKIAWYKNTDGQGGFSTQNIISTNMLGTVDVYATDLDNDGDMDVLSASQNDDKIAWYENLTILGVEGNLLSKIELYPNPVAETLFIKTKEAISSIYIYNLLGVELLKKQLFSKEIDVSNFPRGIYFVSLLVEGKTVTKKMIKQ